MDVRLHLASRIVLSFDYTGGDINALIRQMKPKDLFNRPAHQFLGKIKLVTINPEAIEWIDVETEELPENAYLRGTPVLKQLSVESFNRRVAEEKESIIAAMGDSKQVGAINALGMATFRSGETLCVEVHMAASPGDDRGTASIKLFQAPALVVQREQGGISIVNTKNIAVWQVVPGLTKATHFSVPGELRELKRV